jgi:hypothetical protein
MRHAKYARAHWLITTFIIFLWFLLSTCDGVETQKRFVITTFLSAGPPNDDGLPLADVRSNFHDTYAKYADDVYIHSFSTLHIDPWWRRHYHRHEHSPTWELPSNPGAAQVGYWKYKALLIYRLLQQEPEDTVILYMDSNLKRHPELAVGAEFVRETASYVLSQAEADIWIGYEYPELVKVKYYTKGYTIVNISRPAYVDRIFNRSMLICNRIAVRNTNLMKYWFQKEIMPLFESDDYLAPFPDEFKHPEQKHLTGDQSVWNAYLFNKQYEGHLPTHWPALKYGKGEHRNVFDLRFLERHLEL